MFYLTEIEDYVRVEPRLFGLPTLEAVTNQLKKIYQDYYDNGNIYRESHYENGQLHGLQKQYFKNQYRSNR